MIRFSAVTFQNQIDIATPSIKGGTPGGMRTWKLNCERILIHKSDENICETRVCCKFGSNEICQSSRILNSGPAQIKMPKAHPLRFPLPTFHAKTGAIHVIVESPRGSRNKYVYDEASALLRLKKVLPAGMSFPFNFGFVPGTRGGDGDPLDAVILFDEPLIPGSFVHGRILGAILAKQKRKAGYIRNDRLIVEPIVDSTPQKLCDFRNVLNEMEKFFVTSHQLEGRDFKVIKCVGKREARSLVDAAILEA